MQEGCALGAEVRKPFLQYTDVALHQRPLGRSERTGSRVSDKNVGGADMPKAASARGQAEFDILAIPGSIKGRKGPDGLETFALDVHAEADAARQGDRLRRIGP